MREFTPNQLKEILAKHKKWVESKGNEGRYADLSNADLFLAQIPRANLMNAKLIRADLKGANLRNAKLNEVDLSEAELNNADLSSAVLSGANLTNTDLESIDFEYADLTEADISGANIFHIKTHGWKIEGIKCTHVYNYSKSVPEDDREKSRIDFKEGEFEAKYKKMPTIELVLSGGLRFQDILKIYKTIEEMKTKYNTILELSEMKSEPDGVAYRLIAKSENGLMKAANNLYSEFNNIKIDGNLLKTIRKEKLLSTGGEGLDIISPDLDNSTLFGQPSSCSAHPTSGTVINIYGDVKGDNVAIGQGATATSIINNYANNKEKIDKALDNLKQELPKIKNDIDKLKGALERGSEKEASGAWGKIKKVFAKADEVLKTGEKAATFPQRAFKLYQMLERLF